MMKDLIWLWYIQFKAAFTDHALFISGNKSDIFFEVNAKLRKKAKCLQSNDKRVSAAHIRVNDKSHLIIDSVLLNLLQVRKWWH